LLHGIRKKKAKYAFGVSIILIYNSYSCITKYFQISNDLYNDLSLIYNDIYQLTIYFKIYNP